MPVPVPIPAHMTSSADMITDSYADDRGQLAPSHSQALVPAVHPEQSVNLLNSLLAFYHQERSWVQRTRASLELAFVQGPLVVMPSIGLPPQPGIAQVDGNMSVDTESDSDGSAPSLTCSGTSSENSSNEPTPATSTAGSDAAADAIIKQEEDADTDASLSSRRTKGHGPLTLRATMPARAPTSRWLKRKQSFKLHLGPLSTKAPMRPRMHQHFDGTEPSAELLERFGELLEARMDSCMRITQLVRESNRALLRSW